MTPICFSCTFRLLREASAPLKRDVREVSGGFHCCFKIFSCTWWEKRIQSPAFLFYCTVRPYNTPVTVSDNGNVWFSRWDEESNQKIMFWYVLHFKCLLSLHSNWTRNDPQNLAGVKRRGFPYWILNIEEYQFFHCQEREYVSIQLDREVYRDNSLQNYAKGEKSKSQVL